jgi:hypothetical protein
MYSRVQLLEGGSWHDGSTINNGTLCCIGGFHSFDFDAGDANNA